MSICSPKVGSESLLLCLFHSREEIQTTTPPHPNSLKTHIDKQTQSMLPQWCCHMVSMCPGYLLWGCCGSMYSLAYPHAWSSVQFFFFSFSFASLTNKHQVTKPTRKHILGLLEKLESFQFCMFPIVTAFNLIPGENLLFFICSLVCFHEI